MHWFVTAAVASLAATVVAQPVEADDATEIFIGIHPEDHDLFERTLYDISDPHHKRYGQHLSAAEARDLLRPVPGTTENIKRWLLDDVNVGEHHIEDGGGYIRARVPTHHAQSLSKRSTAGYDQVPGHLRRHISLIQRMEPQVSGIGTSFGKRASQRDSLTPRVKGFDSKPDLEACKDTLIPECLFELYNIDSPPAKPQAKTKYGIAGFNGQTAQFDQLEQFIDRFAPYADGGNFTEDLSAGDNPQGEYPSGEANLNIQWAVAMAFKTSVEYIPIAGENHNIIPDLDIPDPDQVSIEPYLDLTTHLLSLPDDELPQVVSISYGVNEQHIPFDYANTVCDHFGQLGLRGVSMITSSGNLGPGYSCLSNDGTNTTKFLPGFPQTCPYITAVGGTIDPTYEKAINYSGGGFSDYWKRPEWQETAIGAYIQEHGVEWKGYYNETGRAIPDVAMIADGHQIVNHDVVERTGGTSAASPAFGALISLMNNDRFKKGKKPMGFLNPWIYSIGDVGFTDITEGKSVGCQGQSIAGLPSPYIPDAGWSAVKGWDPVTGFGTPDYAKLKKLACK